MRVSFSFGYGKCERMAKHLIRHALMGLLIAAAIATPPRTASALSGAFPCK
jgi:hypothetical protein